MRVSHQCHGYLYLNKIPIRFSQSLVKVQIQGCTVSTACSPQIYRVRPRCEEDALMKALGMFSYPLDLDCKN